MSSASPAFAAAQAYFDALKKYDFNALKEALTPDAVLKIYPEHLKSPGGSNREEILQLMTVALKLVKDAKLELLETCVEDPKVWARVKATATLSNGDPYVHELMYMLEAKKDGNGVHKISKISEMVDVSAVQKVVELMKLEAQK